MNAFLELEPRDGRADEPVECRIGGLEPGERVVLRAETVDEGGRRWASRGTFAADADGNIDLARQAPEDGTWSVPSASGWLWSLRPDGDDSAPVPLFRKKTVEPVSLEVSLKRKKKPATRQTLVRRFAPADNTLVRETVSEDGLEGVLFYPAGMESGPTLIVLSGSGGGLDEPRAALLAAHGFAVLAPAYFGTGSLPRELSRVPLEFFERGLTWLKGRPAADTSRLGIFGYSKGGELALLLASLHPEIRAAGVFSGSSYVWQGLSFGRAASSWTREGKELPFLPMKVPPGSFLRLLTGRPVSFYNSYARGLRAAENPGKAAIAVEKINGPVFLAAGEHDEVWPAAEFSDTVAARLAERGHPHPCTYLREAAGHLVGLPYLPAAQVCRNLIFSRGHFEEDSLATIKAWDALVAFFRENL